MNSHPRVIPIIDKTNQLGSSDEQEVVESLYEVSRKVYPRAVHGVFARWRVFFVLLTQLIYYGTPWLSWNGRQAVLLDLVGRKFYIFGLVLWPQDVIYLTLLLVISALSLFLFTAVAGRLFCGFACPQTVYTEIFLWVERLVEGDRAARMRLDEMPWNAKKIGIKSLKQLIWIAIAAWTGFTFIGYFTPIDGLLHRLVVWNLGPWQSFWIFFYSFMTWGNAGYMREQVCKYMCPYARFQSVMFDRDTWIISYDQSRGEPRGNRSKKVDYQAQGLGACIDCQICVQVCPTGIDIRKGLQYECIGCAACIDACDQVMDKMHYPKGLIRYSTERTMQEKKPDPGFFQHLFRPRVWVYTGLLSLLMVVFAASLWLRKPFRVDVMRDRGALAREIKGGAIENIYRLQLMNHSEQPLIVDVSVTGMNGIALSDSPSRLTLSPATNTLIPFKLKAPVPVYGSKEADTRIHKIVFHFSTVNANTPVSREEDSVFIMPE